MLNDDFPLDLLSRLWLSIQDYESEIDKKYKEGTTIGQKDYADIDLRLDAISEIVSLLHKQARFLLP